MADIRNEDKYTTGRRDEQLRQQENSGAQGLIIGLLVLLGLGGVATAFFFSTRTETPVAPAIAPSPSPASSPPVVENRETIIREKTTEVVPAPATAPPNINITVPGTESAGSTAPPSSQSAEEPSAPASAPSESPAASESAPPSP
ncbi:MAG: hypothetical protein MH252_13220 [Thermosynechococcaceae cyanobacterium MS004]|nr:hypothetical protein [Thermosynechococcaceae cyanobacterium MS004]